MSVDHDQVGGCRELTSLLLMKGMKRIALLGGTMLYTVNMSRLEGFKQAYDMMDQKIDESLLFLELDTADLPPVDLIVRTSGEQRLSNFLLWQAAYAEMWFTPVLWPDFDEATLREAAETFAGRERRYGGR